MSKFKVGDKVIRTGASIAFEGIIRGNEYTVQSEQNGFGCQKIVLSENGLGYDADKFELAPVGNPDDSEVGDAISPGYYQFPNGVWVRQISSYLSSNGGQAVQYIARSTRLDGNNKGEPVENLRKAIKFLEWEIERLEES